MKPVTRMKPLAPPDATRIAETVSFKLPFSAEFASITPLAGDASNRRYFRITLQGGSVPSVILMQLAEPEAFKQSEEAVSGASVHIAELPFTNIQGFLAKRGVTVPTLYFYDRDGGLLYLEDFGDMTLADACRDADPRTAEQWYRQAIDALVSMQVHATHSPDAGCLAFHRRFDAPLLMWEFEHFLEYGITARLERPMASRDATVIRREFERLAEWLAAQPQVFVHRDYHSRNLMVDGDRLGIIDFQDALLGPASYDLASLLKDAYIQLDEGLVDRLIDRFLDGLAAQGRPIEDRPGFRRLFDLTSVQRNLKAAGRFVYIDRVKHNPKFLADIPRVLGYVRRNFANYPELATLRTHLVPYVPELQ